MRKNLMNLFVAALFISIAGCGFAPHSTKNLPPQLNQIYYKADHPYAPFEINLKRRLKACGIKLLPSPEKSSLILTARSYDNPPATNNISSSTQARIYNLTYTATISISDYVGHALLEPRTVSATRSITLQPNEVFATTPQTATIKQEMAQELIVKTINILGARKTFQTLENPANEN